MAYTSNQVNEILNIFFVQEFPNKLQKKVGKVPQWGKIGDLRNRTGY